MTNLLLPPIEEEKLFNVPEGWNGLHCYSEILTKYVKSVLNSIDFEDRKLITGIAVPKLNQTNLNNRLVPLPPLVEQKRIVEKVDMIMDILDKFEKELIVNI